MQDVYKENVSTEDFIHRGRACSKSMQSILGDSTNWTRDDCGRRRSARLKAKRGNVDNADGTVLASSSDCGNVQSCSKPASKRPPRPERKKGSKKKGASLENFDVLTTIDNIPSTHADLSPEIPTRKRPKPANGYEKKTASHRVYEALSDPKFHDNHTLIMNPFDPTNYTRGVGAHDIHKLESAVEAADYITDIYQRLYEAENRFQLMPYTSNHKRVNSNVRQSVVAWLSKMYHILQFDPQTFHLSVYIFDRYCISSPNDYCADLQLVATAALLISTKYEEVDPPLASDPVSGFIEDWYTIDQVALMEQKILMKLDYRLAAPTGNSFLLRFLTLTKASRKMSKAANFYLERAMFCDEFLGFRSSEVALACVCLAISHPGIHHRDHTYDAKAMTYLLLQYTTFTRSQLLDVATLIVRELSFPVYSWDDSYVCHSVLMGAGYGSILRLNPPRMSQLVFD